MLSAACATRDQRVVVNQVSRETDLIICYLNRYFFYALHAVVTDQSPYECPLRRHIGRDVWFGVAIAKRCHRMIAAI